jgi:hypothetical protein
MFNYEDDSRLYHLEYRTQTIKQTIYTKVCLFCCLYTIYSMNVHIYHGDHVWPSSLHAILLVVSKRSVALCICRERRQGDGNSECCLSNSNRSWQTKSNAFRTRSKGCIAWAYNGRARSSVWEHEPRSSSHEATTRPVSRVSWGCFRKSISLQTTPELWQPRTGRIERMH